MIVPLCINMKKGNGNSFNQYLATFTGILTVIASGMHLGWSSPSLPKLMDNSALNITHDQGSWIAAMPLVGSTVGPIASALLLDTIGRKATIALTCVPFLASWIMIALYNSVTIIYVARFIAGIADGAAITSSSIYIAEIAEPKVRGLLGSSISVALVLGRLLINVIGSYLSIATTALVSTAVPILAFTTFIWMPESPYFLILKKRHKDAERNLQILMGKEDVGSDMDRMSNAIKAQTENTGKLLDLFHSKSNRKGVYIMLIIESAYHLSGSDAFSFNIQSIFKEAGGSISAEVSSFIYFGIQLVLVIFSSVIIDRVGRRALLISSLIGVIVTLLGAGTYFFFKFNTNIDIERYSFISLIFLVGFVIFFSLGLPEMFFLMIGELFPTNVKVFAVCLGNIYICVVGVVVSKVFQIVLDAFGVCVPFFIFAACCLICLILACFVVPETKGKNLEEIQELLGGKVGTEVKEIGRQ